MEQNSHGRTPNRAARPPDLRHPLTPYNLEDPADGPPTPPYRRNMSSLTLPPDYIADGSQHAATSDTKSQTRPSLELDTDTTQSGHYAGETLVAGRHKGKAPAHDDGQNIAVHYPDDYGGMLHAMPSPGYPDPHYPKIMKPELPRSFSGISDGYAGSTVTDDENDEDEIYDWSDEEDLVDEEAKFEQKMGAKPTKKKGWGPRR